METIEIIFDNIEATATRLTSTTLNTTWKVVVNDQYFLMQENYNKKETYELIECSDGMDRERATKFAGEIFPMDSLGNAFKKMKLEIIHTDRMN